MTVTAPPRPPRPSDPVTHGEFDALVEALIEEARQRGRRRRRRRSAIAILVALVGAALFALLGRSAQSQDASPALSARSSLAAGASSSMIAFISSGPPGSGGPCGAVYVMNADGSDQRRLADGGVPACGNGSWAMEWAPAWSPDGRRIAFVSGVMPTGAGGCCVKVAIYVMNADGSGKRRLSSGGSPSWSPDGRQIAFDRRGGINVMNADGTGQRRLITRAGGSPAWSPDGRRITFVGSVGSVGHDGRNLEIYVVNADGSGQRRLTYNAVPESSPVWSPDGRRITFVSNGQLWVGNADGSVQRPLTRTNGARNVAPAWSPNGQRIAFERRVGRQKYRGTALEYGQCSRCDAAGASVRFQIWVMNADGSEARRLAHYSRRPVWSPDGRKIAFEYPIGPRGPGGLGKQSDIYVMNADGSGRRNLTRTPLREAAPVWSPVQK